VIVIADSSPLVALVNIGHISILPLLFREIVIPPEIARELSDARRPQSVRDFIAAAPPWLRVQAPARVEPIPDLHEGECAAISLACELGADLLLMDETAGRAVARARHLRITGTIGLLQRAAEHGLLDLADAFARIKETDFWISPKLLDTELERHRAQQDSGKG
jgi:predicted nucleic acid-binding protein